ncbi:MAG: Magnesium and cobalt efflux protein CorC [Alphaproteobacteria bacterium]|nr:Magnesium and cobalt efflux protein CorC [Alphaproteobacteria bacterium]
MSELFVLLIFTLINAFFAMSEIAIVQSSKPLLRQMAKNGSKRAEIALELAENTGRALSTVQVGITLVGILAGAYGGATIAEKITPILASLPLIGQWAEQIALFVVVVLITYLSVVIGELVPKQYALAHPERMALISAYPMTLASKIGGPIVWIFNKSAKLILAVFGVTHTDKGSVTHDEVQAVLSEGAESGAIDPAEYQMLRRIIALDDREVKTIMTPRMDVMTIDVTDDLATIRRKINESGHSRFPVVENSLDNVKGLVVARELLEAALNNAEEFNVLNVMKEVQDLSDNTPCHKVLELFKNDPINFAMVIDEYGTVEGIVTASDILEAIVGSVASNYEDNQHNIVQRDDGSWLVDGMTVTDEIVLTLGIEGLDHEDIYTTLSGYVLHEMGKTPEVGESFEALGHKFEIMDLDGKRIDKVLITKIEPETAESPAATAATEETTQE